MIMSNNTYNQLTANLEQLNLSQMKIHLDEIRDFVTTNVLSFTEEFWRNPCCKYNSSSSLAATIAL